MKASYSIQDLPESERPRERLVQLGAEAMSTAELIAVILGSGTKDKPVLKLAQEIVSLFGSVEELAEATIEEFCQIKGLGLAKAIQLRACFGLGKRLLRGKTNFRSKIATPDDAFRLANEFFQGEKRELFVVILLDTKGCLIKQEIVSMGTLSQSIIHPREVFYPAIRHKAASVILAHNHPSGDPTPSKDDYDVTNALIKVAQIIDIPIHDHVIIGSQNYISLRQEGLNFDS
ncbi:MAG: DNA repair protein RadC [Waddliaceae bacterium]